MTDLIDSTVAAKTGLSQLTPRHALMPVGLIVLLGGLLFMPQPLGTDLYLPSMPALVKAFDVSLGQLAHTMTVFLIGFAMAQLLAGLLADRFGRKPVALWGMAIYTVASAICAAAQSFEMLLAARFLQAAGACTCFAVARAIVRDSFAAHDGQYVLSKINSYMTAAPVTGVLLGGVLVSTLGWRANFGILVIFGCCAGTFVALKLKETLAPADMQRINWHTLRQSYALILRNRTFLSYTATAFLGSAGLFCHLSASSIVYIQILQQTPLLFSVCFALGCFGYLSGTILLRRWVGRLGSAGVIRRGGLFQVCAMVVSASLAGLGVVHWAVIAGCNFFFLIGYGLLMSACQAGSVAPFPERAGTAGSLMGAIQISGGAMAGWWMGIAFNGTVFPMLLSQCLFGFGVWTLASTVLQRYAIEKLSTR